MQYCNSTNVSSRKACRNCSRIGAFGKYESRDIDVNRIKGISITNSTEQTVLIVPKCAKVPNLHTICDSTGEEEVVGIWCLCAEHRALRNITNKKTSQHMLD